MKSIVAVLFVSLCVLAPLVVAEEGKAIGVEPSSRAAAATGQKWALVVGINEYSNLPGLRFARQDALALKASLLKAGFPSENIVVMTDKTSGAFYPTRSNLRSRINQLSDSTGKDDVLLIFFSGHGTESEGQGYLVPIDGATDDMGSLVPLSLVKQIIETSPAKHRLLILDACHSGAKAGDAAASPAKALLSQLSGAAFATISSCDSRQLSYEDEDAGQGVFTSAIIDGLSGKADQTAQGNHDGVINVTELWAYASLKTKQWGLRSGKTQTPVMRGDFTGMIDLAQVGGSQPPIEMPVQSPARLATEAAEQAERQKQQKMTQLMATAHATDNKENGKVALAALAELLKLDPENKEAVALKKRIESYYDPVPGGLMAHWSFDEGSGGIVHDQSGNGYNGTILNGAVWTDGISGKALKFDGIDDYAVLNDETVFRLTSGILTTSIWVKTLDNGDSTLVMKNSGWRDETASGWSVSLFSGKVASIVTANNSWVVLSSNTSVNDGKWHHIVVQMGENGRKIYVDGVLDVQNLGMTSLAIWENDSPTPLSFGALRRVLYNRWDAKLNGVIDEVRIYNCALTQTEIQSLYENQ